MPPSVGSTSTSTLQPPLHRLDRLRKYRRARRGLTLRSCCTRRLYSEARNASQFPGWGSRSAGRPVQEFISTALRWTRYKWSYSPRRQATSSSSTAGVRKRTSTVNYWSPASADRCSVATRSRWGASSSTISRRERSCRGSRRFSRSMQAALYEEDRLHGRTGSGLRPRAQSSHRLETSRGHTPGSGCADDRRPRKRGRRTG